MTPTEKQLPPSGSYNYYGYLLKENEGNKEKTKEIIKKMYPELGDWYWDRIDEIDDEEE